MVTFHGLQRVLQPGEKTTFDETFGSAWELGVHELQTSLYGPEIILGEWVRADSASPWR